MFSTLSSSSMAIGVIALVRRASAGLGLGQQFQPPFARFIQPFGSRTLADPEEDRRDEPARPTRSSSTDGHSPGRLNAWLMDVLGDSRRVIADFTHRLGHHLHDRIPGNGIVRHEHVLGECQIALGQLGVALTR